jgi:hypothetical protein
MQPKPKRDRHDHFDVSGKRAKNHERPKQPQLYAGEGAGFRGCQKD